MAKNNKIIKTNKIQNQIFTVRGQQVMLDRDLAELYQVKTKVLNQTVKRNKERFPEEFMFRLSEKEFFDLESQTMISNQNLRSQIVTSNKRGGRRYSPYVFTEQGVAMLAGVLKSKIAVDTSIKIIKSFVQMRKFLINNGEIFNRLEKVEQKQLKSDKNFEKIFKALDSGRLKPKQGIFYNGQIFDAYILASKIIKTANKEIILIDNYIDETVLQLFTKRKKKIKTTIYTKKITKTLKQDLEKYNQQYQDKQIKIKTFKKSHDRFLIIDNKTIYHLGASLKDLGKKWFAFSRLEIDVRDVLGRLG